MTYGMPCRSSSLKYSLQKSLRLSGIGIGSYYPLPCGGTENLIFPEPIVPILSGREGKSRAVPQRQDR